jgi:hypothetical protein
MQINDRHVNYASRKGVPAICASKGNIGLGLSTYQCLLDKKKTRKVVMTHPLSLDWKHGLLLILLIMHSGQGRGDAGQGGHTQAPVNNGAQGQARGQMQSTGQSQAETVERLPDPLHLVLSAVTSCSLEQLEQALLIKFAHDLHRAQVSPKSA